METRSKTRAKRRTPSLNMPKHNKAKQQPQKTIVDLPEPKEARRTLVDFYESLQKPNMSQSLDDKFVQWNLQLRNGFSLLIHGVGSKRELLVYFATHFIHDMPIVCVDGYKPKLSLKDILHSICKEILGVSKVPTKKKILENEIEHMRVERGSGGTSSLDNLLEIIRFRCNRQRPFCLLVHNLDGPALQSSQNQQIFASLAECRFVYFIASVDNVHAQLCNNLLYLFLLLTTSYSYNFAITIVWNAALKSKFRFCFHQVSTFYPYLEETLHYQLGMEDQSARKRKFNVDAVKHVLESQARTQHRILRVLILKQIETMENLKKGKSAQSQGNFEGLPEVDFLEALGNSEDTLMLSHATLNTQIVDFLDHDLIVKKTSPVNGECYSVPYSLEILKNQIMPLLN